MKTFEGTKGKWKVSESRRSGRFQINIREICNAVDVWYLDEEFIPKKEAEANAKLIAAAPELLEALQHALRVAKTLPNKDSIGVKMLIKNLEQTLNKAL